MPRILALPSSSGISVSLFMAISHSFAKSEIFISEIYNSVGFYFSLCLSYAELQGE